MVHSGVDRFAIVICLPGDRILQSLLQAKGSLPRLSCEKRAARWLHKNDLRFKDRQNVGAVEAGASQDFVDLVADVRFWSATRERFS